MTENFAEQALRRYCSGSLIAEYDAAGPEQKKTLLEALLSVERDNLVQWETEELLKEKNSDAPTHSPPPKRPANRKCPLVKSLMQMGAQYHVLSENTMELCRINMATWGVAHTSTWQYQNMVAIHKHSKHYKNDLKSDLTSIMQTNKSVVKQGGTVTNKKDWSKLCKIGIDKLLLFGTSKGCYVEGTIVGEPIQPMIGGTVLIRDTITNGVLLVAFYNFLPEGVKGAEAEPLLQSKLPMGATIRIVEPFLKIFRDGSRGIRVDNPSEIHVDIAANNNDISEKELLAAKTKGNEFVAKKRYDVALDIYLSAIHKTDFVPTVLSNRAQVYITLGQWGPALSDAAASLTIRPNSKKTWVRYRLCLAKFASDTKEAFSSLLPDLFTLPSPGSASAETASSGQGGHAYNEAGNKAFKEKDYKNAIHFYSLALETGNTVRALLSNWALCSLEIGALNDVVAAAAASIRIKVDEKAVYRLAKALALLGEYELASRVVKQMEASDSLNQLQEEVDKMQNLLGEFRNCSCLISNTPSLLTNWIGPVETFMTLAKGRGVQATRDIAPSEVIMVQRPIASAAFHAGVDGSILLSMDKKVDSTATVKLKAALVNRSERDAIVSQIVGRLSDGTTNSNNPLVPLRDLMRNLDSCPMLLPGHHDYLEGDTRQLTAEQFSKIVSTNVHGEQDKTGDTSDLYPAISMMNHMKHANADFVPLQGKSQKDVAVVATIRHVKKGEEICMQYLPDEAKVKANWGII